MTQSETLFPPFSLSPSLSPSSSLSLSHSDKLLAIFYLEVLSNIHRKVEYYSPKRKKLIGKYILRFLVSWMLHLQKRRNRTEIAENRMILWKKIIYKTGADMIRHVRNRLTSKHGDIITVIRTTRSMMMMRGVHKINYYLL